MGKRGKGEPGHVRINQNAGAGERQSEVPMEDIAPLSERHQRLLGEAVLVGGALALAQSLKVMGDVCQERGHHGHAVIARRARQFVQLMHMHVTRFLAEPDLRLRHPSVDLDLVATHVDVGDTGKVTVHCTDPEGGGWWTFPLDELVAAGPMNDAIRSMTAQLATHLVHEAIGQAITDGKFPGLVGTAADPAMAADWGTPGIQPMADANEALSVDVTTWPAGSVGFEPPPGDEAFQVPSEGQVPMWGQGAPADCSVCNCTPCGCDQRVHHLQVHPQYRLEGGRALPE